MRRLLPLLIAALVAPTAYAAVPGALCTTPSLAAPDARALSGDGYVRVAPDGTASWLLPGVRMASWHGTRAAYWTEPAREGLPSLLCVDGTAVAAGFRGQVAWSPDGDRVGYVDNGVLKVRTGSAVVSLGAAETFDWSPAGDAVAAVLGGVLTVRTLAGSVTRVSAAGDYARLTGWRGGRVFFRTEDDGVTGDAVSVLPDGTGRTVHATAAYFAVSGDGTRVAYADDGTVRTADVDGTATAAVAASFPRVLVFSPDGTSLAFTTLTAGFTWTGTTVTRHVTDAESAGWAGGVWFERWFADESRDVFAGGASVARAVAGHDLRIVRRDADGSYVVEVARLRTNGLPHVG